MALTGGSQEVTALAQKYDQVILQIVITETVTITRPYQYMFEPLAR